MAATTFELPNRERRTSVRSSRSPPTYRPQPVVVQSSAIRMFGLESPSDSGHDSVQNQVAILLDLSKAGGVGQEG